MMSAGVAMSLIVSLQVWAKPCTCNPTLPGLGTPTVTPPPHYPRILIEGHSIRARPRAPLPLQRDTFPTHRLMTEHPPVLRDPNKQVVFAVVFAVACPAGTVHEGEISYSRWPMMPLPERIALGHRNHFIISVLRLRRLGRALLENAHDDGGHRSPRAPRRNLGNWKGFSVPG